jgi:4-amino-4-deoxy-L-arabinose transferase-like glycosyltransferase
MGAERTWSLAAGLGILLVMRLVFAALIPLTEDEAYYRLWAQHLQLGYFDHPPMVAWWLAMGRTLAGDHPLGDRLIAVFASVATTALVFDVALLAGWSREVAGRAALWYAASPLIGFGSILILPDAALSFFWMLTLWAILKVKPDARAWWAAAGAAIGAALLSKYSAVFLGLAILGWLLTSLKGRRELGSIWLGAGAATAAVLLLPNLAWNSGEHWATFVKQFVGLAPRGFTPSGPVRFLATLALLANPLTLPFLARMLARSSGLMRDEPKLLLLLSFAPFLAYLCLHSLYDPVQAHWPAPIYGALSIFAAAGAQGRLSPALSLCRRVAPGVGLAASTLGLLHLAIPATDGFGAHDPAAVLRGWDGFAAQIDRLRRQTGARWVGTLSYGGAAQLAAAWRSPAPVVQVTERARYDFAAPAPSLGGLGLIVDLDRRMATANLADCFDRITPIGTILRGRPRGAGQAYTAVLVGGPKRNVIVEGCRSFHSGRPDVWP